MHSGHFISDLIDTLTYVNYAHNRRLSPDIPAERWAQIYPQALEMEGRFQQEIVCGESHSTQE